MWTHDLNEKIGQWLQGVPCSVLIHFLCASYVSTMCSICHMCPVAAHPDFLLPHSKTTFFGRCTFLPHGVWCPALHVAHSEKRLGEKRCEKKHYYRKPRYDDKEKRKKDQGMPISTYV